MVILNSDHLDSNEDLKKNSKMVTCFIDGFTFGMKANELVIYEVEVNIYIGF